MTAIVVITATHISKSLSRLTLIIPFHFTGHRNAAWPMIVLCHHSITKKLSTMKNLFTHKYRLPAIVILVFSGLFFSIGASAQTKYESVGGVKITIEGTSNIHDWDMKSEKGFCSGIFDVSNTGALTGMSYLNFSVPAESLKSEHSAMDKNTYKALNTSKYAQINFTAVSASIKQNGNGYVLTAKGRLTISGVTKDVVLTANGVMNADKTIAYTGSYQLKMTDYNVQPPSIMFGAIKTGDAVTVKFNLLLKSI